MKKFIEIIKTYGGVFLLFQIPFIILSFFVGWEIIPVMNALVIFCSFLFWFVFPFVSNILDKLTPAEAIGRIIGRYWYIFLVLIILIIIISN